VRLNAPVLQIRREPQAAFVTTAAGEERFDAVVSAAHSDQTLNLLADADESERRVLSAIRYAANRAYLHTDDSLLPRRRAPGRRGTTWAAAMRSATTKSR